MHWTYRVNDIIASIVGVVVPLESNLVTTVNADRLRSLDTSNVALHVFGSDIRDGVVVWWGVNVSTLLVSYTLVLSVDKDVPDGGVGSSKLSAASKSKSED